MSNMKDYMMWLVDQGIGTQCGDDLFRCPEDVNIYHFSLVDRYKNDTEWNGTGDDDEDDMISEDEEELLDDDELGDFHQWSPTDYWINKNGGLTGPAMDYLHQLDMNGELI